MRDVIGQIRRALGGLLHGAPLEKPAPDGPKAPSSRMAALVALAQAELDRDVDAFRRAYTEFSGTPPTPADVSQFRNPNVARIAWAEQFVELMGRDSTSTELGALYQPILRKQMEISHILEATGDERGAFLQNYVAAAANRDVKAFVAAVHVVQNRPPTPGEMQSFLHPSPNAIATQAAQLEALGFDIGGTPIDKLRGNLPRDSGRTNTGANTPTSRGSGQQGQQADPPKTGTSADAPPHDPPFGKQAPPSTSSKKPPASTTDSAPADDESDAVPTPASEDATPPAGMYSLEVVSPNGDTSETWYSNDTERWEQVSGSPPSEENRAVFNMLDDMAQSAKEEHDAQAAADADQQEQDPKDPDSSSEHRNPDELEEGGAPTRVVLGGLQESGGGPTKVVLGGDPVNPDTEDSGSMRGWIVVTRHAGPDVNPDADSSDGGAVRIDAESTGGGEVILMPLGGDPVNPNDVPSTSGGPPHIPSRNPYE